MSVRYGEIGVSGSQFTTRTDGNGRFSALLLPGINKKEAMKSHNWYVLVEQNGQPASDEFKFTTDPIYAVNPKHCADPDLTDEERQQKGCILDPCKTDGSVQIKIVNWQMRQFN